MRSSYRADEQHVMVGTLTRVPWVQLRQAVCRGRVWVETGFLVLAYEQIQPEGDSLQRMLQDIQRVLEAT